MLKTQFENRLDNFPFTETEERNHTEIKDSFNKSVSVNFSINTYRGTMAHGYIREKRAFTIGEWLILIFSSVAIWKLASSCIDLGALSAFSMYLK